MESMIRIMGLPRYQPRILDLGCGSGDDLRWIMDELGQSRCHTIGLDISPIAIGRAQAGIPYRHRLFRHRRHVADLTRPLPVETDSVDVVSAYLTLERLSNTALACLMGQITRVTRPGASLVVTMRGAPSSDVEGLTMIDDRRGYYPNGHLVGYADEDAMLSLSHHRWQTVEAIPMTATYHGETMPMISMVARKIMAPC